jgi:glucose-6-phosphate dehydrogenase assembly protein OpcA
MAKSLGDGVPMADVSESGVMATEPMSVEVGSVEKELAKLWRSAAEGGAPGVSAALTRTLLSNILVYAQSDSEADRAMDAIFGLAALHPARVIIADTEPLSKDRSLGVEISMLCNIGDRSRRLCGEEIRIHTHGLDQSALGTIMPLLIPDLPVYLWTPGEPGAEVGILRDLAHICDHWIVDSRDFASLGDSLRAVVSLGPGREPALTLHDLAWSSLSQWRETIAQHFDPAPAREFLPKIRSVRIVYRTINEPRPSVEALLTASWLIARLNWREPKVSVEKNGDWTISVIADESPVSINLNAKPDARASIEEVSFECEADGKRGEFRSAIADRVDEVILEANVPGVPATRRTVRFSRPTPSDELLRILDSTGADTLYEQALPVFRDLAGQAEQAVK